MPCPHLNVGIHTKELAFSDGHPVGMAERVKVRRLTDEEGRKLQRLVRRAKKMGQTSGGPPPAGAGGAVVGRRGRRDGQEAPGVPRSALHPLEHPKAAGLPGRQLTRVVSISREQPGCHSIVLVRQSRLPPVDALTARELEVLQLVARGATNRDVGRALHVSEATVKSHLLHAFTKLEVNDRTAAVTRALERGLIRLE